MTEAWQGLPPGLIADGVDAGRSFGRGQGRLDDGIVTMESSDEGGWQQATFDDEERGCGITLIAGLMDEFELSSNGPGTTPDGACRHAITRLATCKTSTTRCPRPVGDDAG
jgi:hypothetical protein